MKEKRQPHGKELFRGVANHTEINFSVWLPLIKNFSVKNSIGYGIFRPLVVILSFHSLQGNDQCYPSGQ